MKLLFRRMLPVLLVAGLMTGSAMAQTRIATIDLRKVFDNYWKTKQADASLKERAADMEKEHKNMLEDYKKAREEFQGIQAGINDQAVSQDERDKRKKTAEEKLKYLKDQEETITQYERQARTTLDEQRRRMRDNILTEIRAIINGKAKTSNFSLVIDVAAESANNTPMVLFTNNENDLTDGVLSQLNAAAPADLPKTEEKKDAKPADDKKAEPKK
jgi:outer membrane protein